MFKLAKRKFEDSCVMLIKCLGIFFTLNLMYIDTLLGYVQGMNFIAASLLYHAEE